MTLGTANGNIIVPMRGYTVRYLTFRYPARSWRWRAVRDGGSSGTLALSGANDYAGAPWSTMARWRS